MRLAISNIAWRLAEDASMGRALAALGVDAVELALTHNFPQPLEVAPADYDGLRRFWADLGLEVVSLQALLFGRPDLAIFGDTATREATQQYLERILAIAGRLGARRLVFGSPGNRKVGDRDPDTCQRIAVDFFGGLAHAARREGVVLCIEPNPPAYGCDFVTNAQQGADLVAAVADAGFGLHLDTAGLQLAGDDPAQALAAHVGSVQHVHFSAPQLAPVRRDAGVDYLAAARALQAGAYAGVVAVEMRCPSPDADNRPAVLEAAAFALHCLRAAES